MKVKKYQVKGISCNACKTLIEDAVGEIEGVESVVIDPSSGEMYVRSNSDESLDEEISKAVTNAGSYEVMHSKEMSEDDMPGDHHEDDSGDHHDDGYGDSHGDHHEDGKGDGHRDNHGDHHHHN